MCGHDRSEVGAFLAVLVIATLLLVTFVPKKNAAGEPTQDRPAPVIEFDESDWTPREPG
jgi:hypothetical protein